MLSRRHLRIKVFQALYAYEAARDAKQRISEDLIVAEFKPDLNSMAVQDIAKLEQLTKLALLSFQEGVTTHSITADNVPVESFVAAKNTLSYYEKKIQEDFQYIAKNLIPEVDGIYVSYLKILQLFIELSQLSVNEREREYGDPDNPLGRASGLDTNTVITALRTHQPIENEVIRRGASWQNEIDFVKMLFRDVIIKDETYRTYCSATDHTIDDDLKLVDYILRQIIFKNESAVDYFEKADLYWTENGDLIRRMTGRTLKSVKETSGIQLSKLTDAWDEDQYFMEELFKQTIANGEQYEKYITELLKNWDIDRLALTDSLILKMGIAEMIHFSSIPVKVTINECIELAKEYSTPKSNKFVNGILDTVSKQLLKENIVRKSGKGLI
jgi:transcription antitermination protein NusB